MTQNCANKTKFCFSHTFLILTNLTIRALLAPPDALFLLKGPKDPTMSAEGLNPRKSWPIGRPFFLLQKKNTTRSAGHFLQLFVTQIVVSHRSLHRLSRSVLVYCSTKVTKISFDSVRQNDLVCCYYDAN